MVFSNSASWEPGSEMNDPSNLVPEIARDVPMIKVLGIGGGGSNAVSRMYKDRLPVVEYYALNTDAQHLFRCDVAHRVALGQNLTRSLGSGARPDLGRQAAEESRSDIQRAVEGADMIFLAVGMGGGTGTGAAPVIAQIAKESGALTVAVVSRPILLRGSGPPQKRRGGHRPPQGPRGHVDYYSQ
jgi:cell division GTPase FtsZ